MEFQLAKFNERFRDSKIGLLRLYGEALDYTNEQYFARFTEDIKLQYGKALQYTSNQLDAVARFIVTNDPNRQLRLGYSIVRRDGKLVRSVKEISVGEEVDIKLSSGSFLSEIKNISK